MNARRQTDPSGGGTRDQIVAQVRRGPRTVDELAAVVGTTDNAVRAHLAVLERDGVVRQAGVRRGGGAGKPAVLYELDPAAEASFSHAYPPVLSAVVGAIAEQLAPEQTDRLLRAVGHRLALDVGGEARGSVRERVEAAANVLTALGGDVEIQEESGQLTIRGFGCPLSVAVSEHPQVCRTVETLVGDVAGEPVEQCCDHGDRPRCRFRFDAGASTDG